MGVVSTTSLIQFLNEKRTTPVVQKLKYELFVL
jgi:hypothetical protein